MIRWHLFIGWILLLAKRKLGGERVREEEREKERERKREREREREIERERKRERVGLSKTVTQSLMRETTRLAIIGSYKIWCSRNNINI